MQIFYWLFLCLLNLRLLHSRLVIWLVITCGRSSSSPPPHSSIHLLVNSLASDPSLHGFWPFCLAFLIVLPSLGCFIAQQPGLLTVEPSLLLCTDLPSLWRRKMTISAHYVTLKMGYCFFWEHLSKEGRIVDAPKPWKFQKANLNFCDDLNFLVVSSFICSHSWF